MQHSLPETAAPPKPPLHVPFYYGWVVLAVCFISTFFAGATSQLFTSIMVVPITEELGWTRTEMAGALTVGVAFTAVLGAVFGPLADRFGPRPLVTSGAFVVAAGFFGLAGMHDLWHFYLAYTVGRAVAQAATSGVVVSTTVTNWFVQRRGRAMGFMGMAFQFSNTLLIPAAQFIGQRSSWRAVYGLLGAGTAFFVIAPAALFLRRRPEDLGLLPDGDHSAAAAPLRHAEPHPRLSVAQPPSAVRGAEDGPSRATDVSFTVREALCTRAFWLLVFAESLVAFVSGSLTFNLVSHFADVGISPAASAGALSFFALTSGFSSTIWGFLSERFSERLMAIVSTLLGGVGVFFLIGVRTDVLAVLLCGYYGVAARGEHSMLTLILARYFGRGSFGAIRGAMGPISYVSLGLGPLVGSMAFDFYGTYAGFLGFLILCHLLTAGLLALARQPKLPSIREQRRRTP